jgi:outer membrane protein
MNGGTSYSSLRQQLAGIDPVTSNPIFEKTPFDDQLTDNRSGSVSMTLSIPVFNRLQTKTGVERSRVQLSNAELDLQNMSQTVALEVRQAYLDYQTAVKRLDVTEKQLRSAEQSVAVEQERYNVGASTLVELQTARAAFVDAASKRAQAIYQFIFQSRVIDYYLGALDPNTLLFE